VFLTDLTERGNIPVLEKVMAFAEARQNVLAENIANLETPGYRPQQLSPEDFQAELRRALEERGGDSRKRLMLRDTGSFHQNEQGHLVVTPGRQPADNVLFHDRTNASVEKLMTDVADNLMVYNLAARMLQGSFDGLKTAIRGQV
jgi:flagellar basal-body rod protein FlgB